MSFDSWAIDCPKCGPAHKLIPDSTACAEIAGDCYQWCWYECPHCKFETESEETINGDAQVWELLYKKYLLE